MAMCEFTKVGAAETEAAFKEIFESLPESKRLELGGHANDIVLFLAAAKLAAPD